MTCSEVTITTPPHGAPRFAVIDMFGQPHQGCRQHGSLWPEMPAVEVPIRIQAGVENVTLVGQHDRMGTM
ncbi:MAG: hypothetical protein H6819_05690 [Phycisphaerales bacterium]|nr:hypothetical protein [Phycisphaerales bacterium]MCB9854727.1 hypothetical protein [Phycisphaerales bacterium]